MKNYIKNSALIHFQVNSTKHILIVLLTISWTILPPPPYLLKRCKHLGIVKWVNDAKQVSTNPLIRE